METVIFNGKKLTLMEDAYLNGTHENPIMSAKAVDEEGNEYEVIWNCYECYKKVDDSGNAIGIDCDDLGCICDWDNPDDLISL